MMTDEDLKIEKYAANIIKLSNGSAFGYGLDVFDDYHGEMGVYILDTESQELIFSSEPGDEGSPFISCLSSEKIQSLEALHTDCLQKHYRKGIEFFKSVAEPAVRGVIRSLARIGKINKDEEGNLTIRSQSYSWTLSHDDKVQIRNKHGEQVLPANLDQNSLNVIKTFAANAQRKGYVQQEKQSPDSQPCLASKHQFPEEFYAEYKPMV